MMAPFRSARIFALSTALLLGACQTTANNKIYTDAFSRGAKSDQPSVAETSKDTIHQYRIDDLKPGERPELSSDEAGIWMVTDKAELSIATSGLRITDPKLNAYVNDVVCRVAGDYCKDFRVYIMRIPQFNATMSPNGTMVIYSGFLLRAKNEAQLAAVIGHEISHYLRRHSAQSQKDIVDKTNALMFAQFAAAITGITPINDFAALAAVGSVQAFSRDHEREADGYGQALMVRAGYDPKEAAIIWQRVIREDDAAPDKVAYDPFLSTHPPSEERTDTLNKLAKTVNNSGELRTGETAHQNAIAPLRAEFLRDELAGRRYSTALELLDMLLEDNYRPAEVHYFRGELYRLRGKDKDAEKALSAYRKAMPEDDAPADLYRSYGLLLHRIGKKDEATAALDTYLEKAGDAPDREMIQALIEGNR
jgi:predicted Zn-dependent protease